MVSRLSSEKALEAERGVRSIKAVQLATEGWTYKAIAKSLGVSESTSRDDINEILEEVTDFRRELGKKLVDVQLGYLYRALDVSMTEIVNGTWQAGRTVVAITDQINKLLDLYPRDGMAGSGVSQTLQLSFSNTNINQQNNSSPTLVAGVAGEPEVNPLDKIRDLVNQARLVAEQVNSVSPDEPDFGSDADIEISDDSDTPMIIRQP